MSRQEVLQRIKHEGQIEKELAARVKAERERQAEIELATNEIVTSLQIIYQTLLGLGLHEQCIIPFKGKFLRFYPTGNELRIHIQIGEDYDNYHYYYTATRALYGFFTENGTLYQLTDSGKIVDHNTAPTHSTTFQNADATNAVNRAQRKKTEDSFKKQENGKYGLDILEKNPVRDVSDIKFFMQKYRLELQEITTFIAEYLKAQFPENYKAAEKKVANPKPKHDFGKLTGAYNMLDKKQAAIAKRASESLFR